MAKLNEQPIYTLPQKRKRLIVSKIFTLVTLGTIFYIAIMILLSLIEIKAQTETNAKIISLIILVTLIILGTYLNIHKSSLNYQFFKDRIHFNKKEIKYVDIKNIQVKRGVFDKIFKTYRLQLSKKIFIESIPEEIDIKTYVQQLINYSKKTIPLETY